MLEQAFESDRPDVAERRARLARVLDRLPPARSDGEHSVLGGESLADRARPAAGADPVPVLEPLRTVLPDGLRRGGVAAVRTRDRQVDYLSLALLAGALGDERRLWVAAVGAPELGGVALTELLADTAAGADGLDRLVLAPDPGDKWPGVLIEMAAGFDLVLVRPPADVAAATGRQVDARLRPGRTGHSAAVLVLGDWRSAYLTLTSERVSWSGLHGLDGPPGLAGTGHLTGGRATVRASGRATGGRVRSVELMMPTSSGGLALAVDEPATAVAGRRALTAVA